MKSRYIASKTESEKIAIRIAREEVERQKKPVCPACGDYDDMQTFRPSSRAHYPEPVKPQKKRYFRIKDECGWTYHIATDNMDMLSANIALLVPHVRSAAEITKEDFERESAS